MIRAFPSCASIVQQATRRGNALRPLRPHQEHGRILDHEYVRHGIATLLWKSNRWLDADMLRSPNDVFELGTVHQDHAGCAAYPQAIKVRLVMDNLNTHDLASLSRTFPPAEARRLAERIEIHYTPKHGSWLNIAEIELSALNGQCLRRRIPSATEMWRHMAAWQADRNTRGAPVNSHFTTRGCTHKTHPPLSEIIGVTGYYEVDLKGHHLLKVNRRKLTSDVSDQDRFILSRHLAFLIRLYFIVSNQKNVVRFLHKGNIEHLN